MLIGCSAGDGTAPASTTPLATASSVVSSVASSVAPSVESSAPTVATVPQTVAGTVPSSDELGLGTTIVEQSLPVGPHPLDGLTAAELAIVREVLTTAGLVTETTRYPYVGLHPPDKAMVIAWQPGGPLPRAADVVLHDIGNGAVIEAMVDITGREVVSSAPAPNLIPGYVTDEFNAAINAAKNDIGLVRALDARGIQPNSAICYAFSPGSARTPDEVGKRLLRVSCYAEEGAGSTFWSRPIEGLVATVDVDTAAVLSVVDSPPGSAASPSAPRAPSRPALAPIEISAPNGPNVTVAGSSAEWAGWNFRWRFDRRVGMILNNVSLDVGTGRVPVLYEASMSDLYVPYQHPDPAWSWRTFLDAGEFGLGTTMSELQPGIDCPTTAIFSSGAVVNDFGDVNTLARAMCLFERPTGTPSWRHAGGDLGLAAVGAAGGTELVARTISTVGNYDYLIDAVFGLEGSIRFDVAAAGVVLQREVDAPDQAAFEASADHEHGTLVGPNLVGVHHDHFLNFRLDLDVGGPMNRFVDRRLTTGTVADDLGRTSIWQTSDQVIGVEGPLAVPSSPGSDVWRVEAATGNSLGQRPAYIIDPLGAIATPLVAADDPGLARAPWTANPLWVTAYDAGQLFAGGRTLPNGGAPEDGLPVWVGAQRPIVDVDLVTWFTVGFHHIVRSEDLPTMPVHRASFELRPENVFPANPLLGFEPPAAS